MKTKTILSVCIATIGLLLLSCNSNTKKEQSNEITQQEQVTEQKSSGFSITEETVKKDTAGKVIGNEEFNKYLSSGEYLATPIIKDGKIVEAQLQKASKEQVAELMKMFENSSDKEIGKKAPDFEVTDLNGKTYKLSSLKDKTVVLNFWFTACKPCVIEIPELNELVKENKEVVFLGLAIDKEERIKPFLQKTPFTYNIVPNSKNIADLYKVNSFPTHYIIKNGVIVNKFIGLSSDIKEKIQNAIHKKVLKSTPKKTVSKQIMLTSDSDIRNEKGEKLGMMDAVKMINSQQYTMENNVDENGNEFILLKKR